MTQAQRDDRQAIQDFLLWVDDKKTAGARGPLSEVKDPFVPDNKIEEFFKDDRKIRKILVALGVDDYAHAHQRTIQVRYRKVFCILLSIGKGEFITNFVRHESLDDFKLPFEHEPIHFPKSTDDNAFFTRFHQAQWMFHAAAFHFPRVDTTLGRDNILPFIESEEIKGGKGISATLRRIVIHPAHHQLRHGQKLSQRRPPDTFALKTYRSRNAEHYYETESKAFSRLLCNGDSTPGLIGFYGSFVHGDTYNIILEYADRGTLENYFQTISPPWGSNSIKDFWTSLFGIMKALIIIHGELTDNSDSQNIIQGWHQDIKPANILVLSGIRESDYACHFKLADLGQSHFKLASTGGIEVSGKDSHGTRTYGAPECFRSDEFIDSIPLHVRPGVDIWSFGCICSEAAVWLIRGKDGLTKYREMRLKALKSDNPDFHDPDCFHDGFKVLDCVTQIHTELLQNKRMDDKVTEGILDLINDMLSPKDVRLNARQVWDRAQRYLNMRSSIMLSPKHSLYESPLPTNETRRRPSGSSQSDHGFPSPATTHQQHHSPGNISQATTQAIPPLSPFGPWQNLQSEPERSAQSQKSPVATPLHRQQSSSTQRPDGLGLTIPTNSSILGPNTPIEESPKDMAQEATSNPSSGSVGGFPLPSRNPSKRVTREPDTRQSGSNEQMTSLPVLSALSWMADRKSSIRARLKKTPPGGRGDLMTQLDERDHVFLVDDSASMQSYQDEAAILLEVLAYIVKDSDPDGIDLYFASPRSKVNSKNVRNLKEAVKEKPFDGSPDLSQTMAKILDGFLTNHRKGARRGFFKSKPPRPMTCYILTDGNWLFRENVEKQVKHFVNQLSEGAIPRGCFGIQFISFGDDEDKAAFLDHLDSNLGLDKDIVDNEPSNGNVWKMLLGSISEHWDNDSKKASNGSSANQHFGPLINGHASSSHHRPVTSPSFRLSQMG